MTSWYLLTQTLSPEHDVAWCFDKFNQILMNAVIGPKYTVSFHFNNLEVSWSTSEGCCQRLLTGILTMNVWLCIILIFCRKPVTQVNTDNRHNNLMQLHQSLYSSQLSIKIKDSTKPINKEGNPGSDISSNHTENTNIQTEFTFVIVLWSEQNDFEIILNRMHVVSTYRHKS